MQCQSHRAIRFEPGFAGSLVRKAPLAGSIDQASASATAATSKCWAISQEDLDKHQDQRSRIPGHRLVGASLQTSETRTPASLCQRLQTRHPSAFRPAARRSVTRRKDAVPSHVRSLQDHVARVAVLSFLICLPAPPACLRRLSGVLRFSSTHRESPRLRGTLRFGLRRRLATCRPLRRHRPPLRPTSSS